MLLPLVLRECCTKHVLQAATNARFCIRTPSWRNLHCPPRGQGRGPLHSFTETFLLRRAPSRLHLQSRGAKGRKSHRQTQEEEWRQRNKTVLTYIAAAGVGMIGLSYAAVPLYRLYCQVRELRAAVALRQWAHTYFGIARERLNDLLTPDAMLCDLNHVLYLHLHDPAFHASGPTHKLHC